MKPTKPVAPAKEYGCLPDSHDFFQLNTPFHQYAGAQLGYQQVVPATRLVCRKCGKVINV